MLHRAVHHNQTAWCAEKNVEESLCQAETFNSESLLAQTIYIDAEHNVGESLCQAETLW